MTNRRNHIPDEAERLTLHEVIAQEEAVIGTIGKLQREHEGKRQLFTEKSHILQRTLDATEILRETGSQLRTHLVPLLMQLQSQLAALDADRTAMTTLFPSTSTFLYSWGVIKDGIMALDVALERQLDRTQERITSVAQQLYSTESLRDQMLRSISSFSSMIDSAQESVKAKKEGVLHPIRRLPMEILLHIFEDCVYDEIDGYYRNPPSIFEILPTMALRLAGVCGRWRDIMLDTPYLWRHLRAPPWNPWNRYSEAYGRAQSHLQSYLDRCRGRDIELSIPFSGKIPDSLGPDTTSTVKRLNVELEGESGEWPDSPSPLHLWIYHKEPVSDWVIPPALVSRTTYLTVYNLEIAFQEECRSLKRLEVRGLQPTFNFTRILGQLSHLTDLDLIRAKIEDTPLLVLESFDHFHLQYLGLSRWLIGLLESALSEGLNLSQLRHLGLSDITAECMATRYPFISAQLSATVVRLDFHGGDSSLDAIRSFIDTFRRVNTIGYYGEATEVGLGALYEVRTSRVETPGEGTIRCTREIVHAMPKGLDVVIIHDYEGEGRQIDQQLRKMRLNPAIDTQPINVVFENCLNILPRIRKEFAIPGLLIVVESVDRDLGPGRSNCDPEDVNDWILDRLEAADRSSA